MVMKTSFSNLQVCSAVKNQISNVKNRSLEEIRETLKVDVGLNKAVTLYQYTILCDSVKYKKNAGFCTENYETNT
jgi:hypothetical protein